MEDGKMPLWALFFSMFKTGALTFGGGLAMLPVLQSEFVDRRGLLTGDEFLDLVAIAESTPGPVAVNAATFVGYRARGFLGALIATVGVVLPSFLVIFLISLFFDAFRSSAVIARAFLGIRVAVVYLIVSAAFRMLRGMKKSAVTLSLFGVVFAVSLGSAVIPFSFPTVGLILLGALVGICAYFLSGKRGRDV